MDEKPKFRKAKDLSKAIASQQQSWDLSSALSNVKCLMPCPASSWC